MWETGESPFEFEWEERFAADKEFLFVSFLFEWTFWGEENDGSMYDLEAFIFFVRIFVFSEVSYQRQISRVKVLGE